jgi:hypothetical protein
MYSFDTKNCDNIGHWDNSDVLGQLKKTASAPSEALSDSARQTFRQKESEKHEAGT